MSDVTVTIGGRSYTVACADGQEAHVTGLGMVLDEKLQQLGGSLSPQESQNLLFAGLFVADDLHEARKQVEAANAEKAQVEESAAAQQREANLAIGMRDELKLKIGELEGELDGLQSAQQRHNAEVDDMRRELGNRRQEAQDAREAADAQSAKVTELTRELEAMTAKADGLASEKNALEAKVERLGAMTAVAAANGNTGSSEDLAPALERFAELLEECAEKLEAGTAAP